MKWFVVETNFGQGRSDYEHHLYCSMVDRQVRLPQIRGEITRKYSTLRVPLPKTTEPIRWSGEVLPTRQQYEEFLSSIIALAPQHAEEIRSAPPGSVIGHYLVARIGPACPEIEPAAPSYIVRDRLMDQLRKVQGLQFFEAYLNKLVPLQWELGEPVPRNYPPIARGEEPESYVLDGKHSPQVAALMGGFHEVVVPTLRWHPITKVKPSRDLFRIEFPGTIPSRGVPSAKIGLVKIEVESPVVEPWFRVVPAEEGVFGVYTFVREDVYEILREPGKWTLEFRPAEQI